jgi:hypothetical protein
VVGVEVGVVDVVVRVVVIVVQFGEVGQGIEPEVVHEPPDLLGLARDVLYLA